MSSINDKLIQLAETKNLIREAIVNKGVELDSTTPFRDYADKIREIPSSEASLKPTIQFDSRYDGYQKTYGTVFKGNTGRVRFAYSRDSFLPSELANCQEFQLDIRFLATSFDGRKLFDMYSPKYTSDASLDLHFFITQFSGTSFMYLIGNGGDWGVVDYGRGIPNENDIKFRWTFDRTNKHRIYIQDMTSGDEGYQLINTINIDYAPTCQSNLADSEYHLMLGTSNYDPAGSCSGAVYILEDCKFDIKKADGTTKSITFVE